MTKLNYAIILPLALGLFFVGCKKDEKSTDQNKQTEVKKSKMELLTQVWTLTETFIDGKPETTNGTGQYEFTKDGGFNFKGSSGWSEIGWYVFNNADSTQIAVTFKGLTTATFMDLEVLNENELTTHFTSNAKKFIYKYKR